MDEIIITSDMNRETLNKILEFLPHVVAKLFRIPFVGIYLGLTLYLLTFPLFLVWLKPDSNSEELPFFQWVRYLQVIYVPVLICSVIGRYALGRIQGFSFTPPLSALNIGLSAYLITNLLLGIPLIIMLFIWDDPEENESMLS